MNEQLIYDIFLYFAKFIENSKILTQFDKDDPFSVDYDTLKTSIENMSQGDTINELEHYIFGNDEDSLSNRLQKIDGKFLFVEYADISSDIKASMSTDDYMTIRVVVAENQNHQNSDEIERLIRNQQNLIILQNILRKMIDDSEQLCPQINFPASKIRIIPVEPTAFFSNVGWMAELIWQDNNFLM